MINQATRLQDAQDLTGLAHPRQPYAVVILIEDLARRDYDRRTTTSTRSSRTGTITDLPWRASS